MKTITKSVVILTVLLLLPAAVFGLDIKVGIKGGAGFPFYVGDDYDSELSSLGVDTQLLIAYEMGGFISIGMEMVALEVDLFFTSAGGAFGNSNIVYNFIDNFIEIPILVKLRFKVDEITASVYGGADILIKWGYFTWQTIDPDTGDASPEYRWPEDELNPTQYGLVFGVGMEVPFEGFFVTADARYCLGLTGRHNDTSPEGEYWFQDNIQILVGIGMELNY
ncbi:MAG: outer membrane beta-barrel protein [Spirochaetia bacterium]